ncbi:MAG: 1,2-phenylacetyl-CoA epoxidase subunit PaaC [Chitinophagaceae bacterium]
MTEKDVLSDYILHLADNSMILGQRCAEWCGHGPVLEQDIALTNIALDLIGEARSLYHYAADIKGGGATEDSEAFLRDVLQYRNCLLCEQPNTDWAYTIVRQFFYDTFHYHLHKQLSESSDNRLKEIALKTIKESTYHLKWSSEWMIRLGDGTELSRNKMQTAVNDLWEYTGEFFNPSETETQALAMGFGADLSKIAPLWRSKVEEIMEEATLSIPGSNYQQKGGKKGYHSEHLGYILAEMQYLQRAYPGAEW